MPLSTVCWRAMPSCMQPCGVARPCKTKGLSSIYCWSKPPAVCHYDCAHGTADLPGWGSTPATRLITQVPTDLHSAAEPLQGSAHGCWPQEAGSRLHSWRAVRPVSCAEPVRGESTVETRLCNLWCVLHRAAGALRCKPAYSYALAGPLPGSGQVLFKVEPVNQCFEMSLSSREVLLTLLTGPWAHAGISWAGCCAAGIPAHQEYAAHCQNIDALQWGAGLSPPAVQSGGHSYAHVGVLLAFQQAVFPQALKWVQLCLPCGCTS